MFLAILFAISLILPNHHHLNPALTSHRGLRRSLAAFRTRRERTWLLLRVRTAFEGTECKGGVGGGRRTGAGT